FVNQALERRPLLSPAAVVAAPAETTGVQYRALRDAVRSAGISRIHVVAKSLAACVGSGVPVDHAPSTLVLDLGAGVTEIAVISAGMVTLARSLPYGGIDLDEALRRYLRRRAGIQLTRAAAEDIKLRVGTLDPAQVKQDLNLLDVLPPGADTSISPGDLATVLAEAVEPIVEEVRWILEQLSPREWGDIETGGAMLCGGGALLRGFAQLLSTQLGLRVAVAEDPLGATVLGLSAIAGDVKSLSLDGEHVVSMGLSSSLY
ncbi:MAG: rod shape-determining protein, partial [Armatimonadetes bacterium]|nr:rod shape-determining protein [Armatimonadota bacterium]